MTDDQDTNPRTGANTEEQAEGDGQTVTQRPLIKLDPANVPPELHLLIPYAEKWGIQDRELQRQLLRKAPIAEVEELCMILYPIWDEVWSFARSHSISGKSGSYEVGIFSELITASEEAGGILAKERPKRWLEIIGWPENFPAHPFDPTKIPLELKPLVPHIEKWVREDDIVRVTAMKVATNPELEEFVFTVNRIGIETVKHLALQMTDDKTRQTEGYVILEMLELAEDAEHLLRTRRESTSTDDVELE